MNDYINSLLFQNIGFETQEEYYEFILDKFSSYLEEMKATYQAQEDDNGFFSKLYDGAKKLFGLGTSSKDVEDSINKYEQMVKGLTDAINGNSEMSFEQVYEYYTGTTFSTEKIDEYLETSNIYSAVMIGCQYDSKYIENFEKETGKSVNEIIKNYAQCQLDTFGDASDVKNIVEEYSKDQQTYADKLSSIVSIAGMACTVVGAITTFFCPPAGMALLSAGKGIAISGMFIDNAIDLVDNATDSDGLTKNEIKDLALETSVEAISYAAGRGIGKLTNGLNSIVSSKVAEAGANNIVSYIAGQAAETVTDTALSLGADYAIAQGQSLITTGELMNSEDYWSLDRFLGEGKNQLIGILTGLSSAKVSAYQQGIIKTAQDMVLDGDTDSAKTYIQTSGMKMDDTSFEYFVKNVQDVETQVKLQNEGNTKQAETAEDITSKPIADVETQKSIEVKENIESVKNDKVKPDNSETITKKIGLQFFAEKANEETAIDYSKQTYDEKAKLLADKGVDEFITDEILQNYDDSQLSKFVTLINKRIPDDIARDIVEIYTETQYENFLTLINKDIKPIDAMNAQNLNKSQCEIYSNLINYGVKTGTALEITCLDEIQASKCEAYIKSGISPENAYLLANVYCENYSSLKLGDKNLILDEMEKIKLSIPAEEMLKSNINIDYEIEKLRNSIKQTITITEVSKTQITQMMKGFFANNNSELENTLTTTDFSKYGKNGIPLEYSRTEFLSDLSAELTKLSTTTQNEIINKLGIDIIQDESGNITGYDGIIDLTKLSSDVDEGKVLELANNFVLNNKVITGDSKVDNALNSLISGMPEFINVIGKQQHETHELSVDSHILTVLQNAMSNPDYENLSNSDKFCLKFATVLHDIAKSEGVVDDGHAKVSALYTNDILDKINLPSETKNRICEIVNNHHWLKEYNTGEISADQVAARFRRTGDLTVVRILAEADLKGVSDDFYKTYSSALDSEKQNPITDSLGNINSTGQIFLTNSIIDKSKVPTVEYNGKTYQIINFSDLSSDTDLQQYGFEPNTTTDNLRLLVHAISENRISEDLGNIIFLEKSLNDGFLCSSFISLDNDNTHENKKFGVTLQSENTNIGNSHSSNQGTGWMKGYETFEKVITGNGEILNDYRNNVPSIIKERLGLNDSEYSELYSTIQKYKHASQLDNIESVTAGNKTFTGSEIKEAIISANDSILNPDSHNEINVFSPQVNAVFAKVNTIDEVPQDLLDFAEKHNLPIYLLGAD